LRVSGSGSLCGGSGLRSGSLRGAAGDRRLRVRRDRDGVLLAEDLRAHDGLVEAELAVELLRGGGGRGEVDDGVDAFRLLLDLVGQATAAPDVDLVDGATVGADDIEELVEARTNGPLIELRVEDDHQFVLV